MHELMHSVTRVNLRSLVRTLAPSLIVALLLCGSTMAGKIPVPGTPVPITLQTFVLMTAALTLGWRRATAGTVLYLGLGAAGLPVFSGGGSTLSLIGPSGGFLFGFVPSVMLTAVLAGTANRAITSICTRHLPAQPASSHASWPAHSGSSLPATASAPPSSPPSPACLWASPPPPRSSSCPAT